MKNICHKSQNLTSKIQKSQIKVLAVLESEGGGGEKAPIKGHIYMYMHPCLQVKLTSSWSHLWVDLPMLWVKHSCKIQENKI